MRSLQTWLGRPRLAWYYIASADPEAGAPLMAYIDFRREPGLDYEVGGRRYGVFARDWRRGGVEAWLDLMAEREPARRPRRRVRTPGRRRCSRCRGPTSRRRCAPRCATCTIRRRWPATRSCAAA